MQIQYYLSMKLHVIFIKWGPRDPKLIWFCGLLQSSRDKWLNFHYWVNFNPLIPCLLCLDTSMSVTYYPTLNNIFEKDEPFKSFLAHLPKENESKRKKREISPCVPAHQAATRNRRPPTDSSINFHVGGSTLFRPHTWIHTRTHI